MGFGLGLGIGFRVRFIFSVWALLIFYFRYYWRLVFGGFFTTALAVCVVSTNHSYYYTATYNDNYACEDSRSGVNVGVIAKYTGGIVNKTIAITTRYARYGCVSALGMTYRFGCRQYIYRSVKY